MDEIRRAAFECALRACAFGSLAIFCVMFGLSFEPRLALQSGGLLTTLMAVILVLKSQYVRTQDHRRTEMWLYLAKESRPPAAHAQRIVSGVLRDIYLTFAMWSALAAVVLWALALLFVLAGK